MENSYIYNYNSDWHSNLRNAPFPILFPPKIFEFIPPENERWVEEAEEAVSRCGEYLVEDGSVNTF